MSYFMQINIVLKNRKRMLAIVTALVFFVVSFNLAQAKFNFPGIDWKNYLMGLAESPQTRLEILNPSVIFDYMKIDKLPLSTEIKNQLKNDLKNSVVWMVGTNLLEAIVDSELNVSLKSGNTTVRAIQVLTVFELEEMQKLWLDIIKAKFPFGAARFATLLLITFDETARELIDASYYNKKPLVLSIKYDNEEKLFKLNNQVLPANGPQNYSFYWTSSDPENAAKRTYKSVLDFVRYDANDPNEYSLGQLKVTNNDDNNKIWVSKVFDMKNTPQEYTLDTQNLPTGTYSLTAIIAENGAWNLVLTASNGEEYATDFNDPGGYGLSFYREYIAPATSVFSSAVNAVTSAINSAVNAVTSFFGF